MKVLVNGKPVSMDTANVKAELARIFQELHEQKQVVQDVVLNGVRYLENDSDRLAEQLTAGSKLEITTIGEAAAISALTAELQNYLPKVVDALDSIPELLYGEMSRQEDWQMVGQLLEGMSWVFQSVFHLLRHAEEQGDPGKMGLERFSQDFAPLSAELERLLQDSEYTAAGDILKYEMVEVFGALADHLANGDSA